MCGVSVRAEGAAGTNSAARRGSGGARHRSIVSQVIFFVFRFLLPSSMIAAELCFHTRCNYISQNLDQFCERYNANGGFREFQVEAFVC